MAISLLFKVGTTDYTGNIVQNTWNVNRLPVYKTYKDANEETHRRFLRNKISGKFQMVFSDIADYAAFKTTLEANRSATNFTLPCTVYDGMSGEVYTINAFLDYEIAAKQSAGLTEYIEPFEVKIEEK